MRRAAAKTLSACVVTRVDMLEQYLTSVLPALVACFRGKEIGDWMRLKPKRTDPGVRVPIAGTKHLTLP